MTESARTKRQGSVKRIHESPMPAPDLDLTSLALAPPQSARGRVGRISPALALAENLWCGPQPQNPSSTGAIARKGRSSLCAGQGSALAVIAIFTLTVLTTGRALATEEKGRIALANEKAPHRNESWIQNVSPPEGQRGGTVTCTISDQSGSVTAQFSIGFREEDRLTVLTNIGWVLAKRGEPKLENSLVQRVSTGLAIGLSACGCTIWLVRKRKGEKRKASSLLESLAYKGEIFVSYAHQDQDRVGCFAKKLQEHGVGVWMDRIGIDGAAVWAAEIAQAIQKATVFVLMASRASFASDHVVREISLAIEHQKPILPLYLEPAEAPSALRYSLAGIQYIELYGNDEEKAFTFVLRSLERLGVGSFAIPELHSDLTAVRT